MSQPIILAILQNQWFKNPERVRLLYERRPEARNFYIKRFLFMGCRSGQILKSALGARLCEQIIWEESSPAIGGESASSFKADPSHILEAIARHQPDIIICFGKKSGKTVANLNLEIPVIFAPHPTARRNPQPELREIPEKIKSLAGSFRPANRRKNK